MSALAEARRPLEPPWTEVARLCREMALLRSEGRHAEALLLLNGTYAGAVGRARASVSSDYEADALLKAVEDAEAARLAEAEALCAYLAPILIRRLGSLAGSPPAAPTAKRGPAAPGARAGGEKGIADFIDDMLEQQRAAGQ